MFSSMWLMSIFALLLVDVGTGALQQDSQPRRCYQCSPTNITSCQHGEAGWLSATCPNARPHCATVALAPDFASSLGCATAAAAPCSLTSSPRQTLELTCICDSHLCNAPFSDILRDRLSNFSSPYTNDSALTEAFLKLSNFANVSASDLYKAITVATDVPDNSTTVTPVTDGSLMPRAEALKQQTVPSDDDEDESEGSGAYEESRHIHSQSASAPAAPSSYLPAEKNNACSLTTFLITPISIVFIVT